MSRAGVRAWARRRDGNEASVFDAARKVGAVVLPLEAFDALLLYRGQILMIDVKMPKGRPTKRQEALIAAGWPLHYVASREQLLALLGVNADWPSECDE